MFNCGILVLVCGHLQPPLTRHQRTNSRCSARYPRSHQVVAADEAAAITVGPVVATFARALGAASATGRPRWRRRRSRTAISAAVPNVHALNSAPGPPSSQLPSPLYLYSSQAASILSILQSQPLQSHPYSFSIVWHSNDCSSTQ